MNYKLFLDDIRNPIDCSSYMHKRIGRANSLYLEQDWIIVKNYDEFVDTINTLGLPQLVSFDHDLADEHYDLDKMDNQEEYSKLYETFQEKTGYDCLKWMVDYHMENDPQLETFPVWLIHTMNPSGYQNIKQYIQNYLKTLK